MAFRVFPAPPPSLFATAPASLVFLFQDFWMAICSRLLDGGFSGFLGGGLVWRFSSALGSRPRVFSESALSDCPPADLTSPFPRLGLTALRVFEWGVIGLRAARPSDASKTPFFRFYGPSGRRSAILGRPLAFRGPLAGFFGVGVFGLRVASVFSARFRKIRRSGGNAEVSARNRQAGPLKLPG